MAIVKRIIKECAREYALNETKAVNSAQLKACFLKFGGFLELTADQWMSLVVMIDVNKWSKSFNKNILICELASF